MARCYSGNPGILRETARYFEGEKETRRIQGPGPAVRQECEGERVLPKEEKISYLVNWKRAVLSMPAPSPRSSFKVLQDFAYDFGAFQLNW